MARLFNRDRADDRGVLKGLLNSIGNAQAALLESGDDVAAHGCVGLNQANGVVFRLLLGLEEEALFLTTIKQPAVVPDRTLTPERPGPVPEVRGTRSKTFFASGPSQ